MTKIMSKDVRDHFIIPFIVDWKKAMPVAESKHTLKQNPSKTQADAQASFKQDLSGGVR